MRTLSALVLLVALACGGGAPPRLPLADWIEEAERSTDRWQAALAWCKAHPEHERCQPVLRAEGEIALRRLIPDEPAPVYDKGDYLPVVPPELEESAP